MPATIILGGQWGDEGKGKLTDALAGTAQMVVRANGGSNAGHTVKTDKGTFKLHLVPSGILNDGCICVIGAGVVIEPATLIRELAELRNRGIDVSNLRISDRAHLVLPYHPALDRLEESRREQDEIGTTLRGNGPAYADKVARHGLRVCDLVRPEILRRKLAIELDSKNQQLSKLYGEPELDFNEIYHNLIAWGEELRPFITATEVLVQDKLSAGSSILIECAQGAMLDIDYGSYPYVTSSSPTAAGACQGAGIAPNQIERIVAVYKAYSTRVGSGPMPSELHDETGQLIRERGNEYGTTTGRPRRTGWFDAVAARHTSRLNGVTDVALTLVDVLDVFDEIKLCSSYNIGGKQQNHLPALVDDLVDARPQWTALPGWQTDTTSMRTFAELPSALKGYLFEIETILDSRVRFVGVGPGREQLIDRDEA
ncbi:MAG TPA: adenylosuccinate synthase [Thermomicrobiales bacterium]|nr:adenylosuccinate synthase [Thermomicrobiales bacterium]